MSREGDARERFPRISVVVPVYNGRAYLGKCLDSILAQTYPNLEVLVVDDGSTDGTDGVCRFYAEQHRQLRVVCFPENRGPSAAKNAGLRAARGEYLTFVDADDFIEADMLERLYESLTQNGSEISICGIDGLRLEGGPAGAWSGREAVFCLSRGVPFRHLTVGKLCATSLLKRFSFDETVFYSEDLLFYYQVFSAARRVSYLPDQLYHVVPREGSQSRGKLSWKKCTSLAVNAFICRDAAARFPEALPGFQCVILKADMWLAALAVGKGTEDASPRCYLKRLQEDIRRHFTWRAFLLCPWKKAAAILTLYTSVTLFWGLGAVYWQARQWIGKGKEDGYKCDASPDQRGRSGI